MKTGNRQLVTKNQTPWAAMILTVLQKDAVEIKEDFSSDAAVITKMPINAPAIVISQSKTEEGIWYRIAVKQNGKVVCGYVTSDNVKLLASIEKPVAAQLVEEKVRLRNVATDTGSYIRNKDNKIISLSMGDCVWIIKEVSDHNLQEKWFEVAVEIAGTVYKGYVQETPVYLMETVIIIHQ